MIARPTVAALFVETGGVYYGVPGVDPWDQVRDARTYAGPFSVVAHPPCARWSRLAKFTAARFAMPVGGDGGCFESALTAVRRYGGVLEHPAWSLAWRAFQLPRPTFGGWSKAFDDPGWVTAVAQVAYGHAADKLTWLYVVSDTEPTALNWTRPPATGVIATTRARGVALPQVPKAARDRTPVAFAAILLAIARQASR